MASSTSVYRQLPEDRESRLKDGEDSVIWQARRKVAQYCRFTSWEVYTASWPIKCP